MKKRILSLFLAAAMCLSLPTATASSAQEEPASVKKNVMPVQNNLLGYNADTKQYDKLYFGTYYADEDTEGEPYVWRILDSKTSTGTDGLFLLSMKVYDGVRFTLPFTEQENWYAVPHNVWTSPGCSAREWCKTLAESSTLFSDAERGALLATSKEDSSYNSKQEFFNSYYGRVRTGALDGDKVFYISAEEFEDERYGLGEDTDYDSPRYALRSAVDESYTVDDITINDGTIAVAMKGQSWSSLSTVRIYHQEFSGYQFPKELTETEKFFIGSAGDLGFFGNFFPTGAEEAYTYQYNAVIARPATNLDGSKVLCITAADNSGHTDYGIPDDYADNTEWKAVLINNDSSFKQDTSITNAPENNLFDKDGGTVTVSHPALDTLGEYTDITATFTDKDGALIRYGTICSDQSVTSSDIEIPAGLSDGVYTLRITAEQRCDEKISDIAAEPFEIDIKIANAHNHPLCAVTNCTEHEDSVDWTPITTTEELAAMEQDGHYFLIGDVAAPETACVGHLCTNGFSVTGTFKAGCAVDGDNSPIVGLTLCDCTRKTEISDLFVESNAIFTQYGLNIKGLSTGENSTVNIGGGSNGNGDIATGYTSLNDEALGDNTKINIQRRGYVSSTELLGFVELPEGCVVNVYNGGTLENTSLNKADTKVIIHSGGSAHYAYLGNSTSTLTLEEGGELTKVTGAVSGSVINLYRSAPEVIVSEGIVNIYGAVSGTEFTLNKVLNICADLGEKPEKAASINIKKDDGTLKLPDGIFTNGWNTYMADAVYADYFVSVSGYTVGIAENGELRCEKNGHAAGSHPICGATCTHNGAHTGVEWTEIKAWSDFGENMLLTGGNYCLTSNVTSTRYAGLTIQGNVTVCLNGYKLGLNGGKIELKSGTLNICDCVGTGRISGGSGVTVPYQYSYGTPKAVNDFGGAVYMSSGTKLNLYGGTIRDNIAHFGGAVYVPANSTFTMYGGKLSNNTAGGSKSTHIVSWTESYSGPCHSKGGAVYLDGGTFVMNGGTISGNKAETESETAATGQNDGGGAVYISGGTLCSGAGQFIMNGGTITGNSTSRYSYRDDESASWDIGGCGVRVHNGTFTMNNGTINQGDPIQVDANGTFNLIDGDVCGGGCSYCRTTVSGTPTGDYSERYRYSTVWQTGGSVNMSGGTVSNSGSVNLLGGVFNMNGGSLVGNYPLTINAGTFNLRGGLIGSKETHTGSCGVTLNAGTFNVSGGEVAGYNCGVQMKNGAVMGVSGTAKIFDNGTTNYGYQNPKNVYLENGAKINAGNMSSGAKVGVTMATATGVFTNGGSGYADSGYFVSDNNNYNVSASGKNLQLSGTPVSLKKILADGASLPPDPNAPDVDLLISIKVGETVQLTPVLEPASAAYSWNDNNNRYVSLNTTTGELTGLSTCTRSWIELIYDNGRQKKGIRVVVTEPDFYTVSYDMQSHGTQIDPLQAEPGALIEEPTTPEETGYTFGGWYKDTDFEEEWDFENDTVTSNVTLYAKWTAKSYAVTLNAAGGYCDTKNVFLTCGKLCDTLPVPTRKGYDFTGWYDFEGDKLDASTTLSKELPSTQAGRTLTARWTPIPAKAPTVTAGKGLTLTYGYKNSGNISVTATANSGHTIIGYQWYQCDDTSKTNSQAVSGATNASYIFATDKNAGTYHYYCEVTAKRSDNGETATAQSDVITVSVNKAKLNATVRIADYSYGSEVSVPAITGNSGNGAVTYRYGTSNSNSGGSEWKNIEPTSLNVGTYYLYAEIAETANYEKFTTPAIAFKINTSDPVVTWPTLDPIFVNDTLANSSLKGGVGDGTFTITGSKTWTTSGSKTTEVTFTPNNSNYNTIKNKNVTITVNKRTIKRITTEISDINDKDYGTALSALNLPSNVNIITDDEKTFTVPITWSGYDAHTLTKQTVTGTLNLSAISNEVKQPTSAVTAKVSVKLKELIPGDVTFNDKNALYTGNPIAHTIESLPTGVSAISYSYNGKNTANVGYVSENAPTDAGSYTVTAKFTMQAGYAQKSDVTAQLVIGKATPEVIATAINRVYSSATLTNADISGDSNGVAGNWSWKDGSPKNVADSTANGKTWEVVFTPTDTVNYNVTHCEINVTIRAKEIAVSNGSYKVSKVYDTTTAAGTPSGELNITGIIIGDNVTVMPTPAAYTSADVGGQSEVNVLLALSGSDKDNYTLSTDTVAVPCEITKATPRITGVTATVTYNKAVSNEDITANTGGVEGDFEWKNVTSYGDIGTRTFEALFTPTDTTNYESVDNITVSVTVNKAAAPVLNSIPNSQVYGTSEEKTVQIAADIMPADSGDIAYSVGVPSINGIANVVKFTVDTSGLITYIVADGNAANVITLPVIITTTRYENATVNVIITITQATPTGKPTVTKIHSPGKTLADSALTTENGTFSVEGSVKWVDENNNDLDVSTEVERNTAYKWLFTPASSNYTTISGTITLYSPSSGDDLHFMVKFDTNGGSNVSMQTVKSNSTATEPKNPQKDGYIFDGWYSDARLTKEYDFDTTVTRNITVYAKWTEAQSGNQEVQKPSEDNNPADQNPQTNRPKNPFADVNESDWFYESVIFASQSKLMSGTTATEFAPNLPLTRGMLVTVLYRLAGEPSANNSMLFTDVSAYSYYLNAVAWAEQNGIVAGINQTEFAPEQNITREQIAVILYRYALVMGYDVTQGGMQIREFADFGDISDYAIDAMTWAVNTGVMQGKPGATLNPKDFATRAEIAIIIKRFIENNK